jgi:DNA replication and repair protein RecF
MFIKKLFLQNFRSYEKAEISFENTTLIVGPNTSGKTNLIEAVYLLASGKSFKTDKDIQMLKFREEVGRVKAEADLDELEVVLTSGVFNGKSQVKKFLVNGVAKRRVDFAGNLSAVLFSPEDLDIIVDSPGLRRRFLDDILEMVDRDYRIASLAYTKSIRQRNALLEKIRDRGAGNEKQLEYWDNLVIENGNIITRKRGEFIEFLNTNEKDIFDCIVNYDASLISRQRLDQYQEEEVAAAVTLVGPHRDDFSVSMFNNTKNTTHDVKFFGSRGQQRLVVLQLKVLQLQYVEKSLGKRPILLLDDIFSELDEGHINLVLEEVGKQQTIITTTHRDFIPKELFKTMRMIELK